MGTLFIILKYRTYGATLIVSVILTTICWTLVNGYYNSFYGVTSTIGFNLINHTGDYLEKGFEYDPEIVDIYLKYRNERDSLNLPHEFTIWDAKSEIQSKLNLSKADLSKRLIRLSIKLITWHPFHYLKSVQKAIFKTILFTNYDDYKQIWFKLPGLIGTIIIIIGTFYLFLFVLICSYFLILNINIF